MSMGRILLCYYTEVYDHELRAHWASFKITGPHYTFSILFLKQNFWHMTGRKSQYYNNCNNNMYKIKIGDISCDPRASYNPRFSTLHSELIIVAPNFVHYQNTLLFVLLNAQTFPCTVCQNSIFLVV